MPGNKQLPRFKSLDELIEFFETHDMGEYGEQLPEVHFEVDLKKRVWLFALDEDLAVEVSRIARLKRMSPEKLIDAWVREKVSEEA